MLFYGLIVVAVVAVVVAVREYRRIVRESPADPAPRVVPPAPPPAKTPRAVKDRPVESPSDKRLDPLAVDWIRVGSVQTPRAPRAILALPVRGTVDPGFDEWDGYPWFDSRSCWGCDRSCKRRAFRPYAGCNIGAEIRGASAARARVEADQPYSAGLTATSTRTAPPDTRRSTDVDALWDHQCEECGRLARRSTCGLEPVRDSAVAVESGAEESAPF